MKVLLVSRFNTARSPHAPFYQRALERLGSAVVPVNLERTGWLDRLTQKDVAVRLEQSIRQAEPDLILVTDGEVLRQDAPAALRPITRARWAYWLNWQEATGLPDGTVPGPDDAMLVAGRERARRWTEALGRPVHRLEAGCDPSVHRPLRVREPFRANVVFAGTATPYREAVLSELVEFGLAIWGSGWKKTRLREYCRGEQLSMENYVRAYAGATVGVNLAKGADRGDGGPLNARLFELAAIGVPQVVDGADLEEYFVPGESLLVHDSVELLRTQVKEVLADSALRERLAAAGRQAALRRHTYMHRMRELLATAGFPG